MRNRLWALIFVFAAFLPAKADAVFLLEEPYGRLGSVEPMGHAAVYLTGVCAASPTRLRRCEPGEAGVVISRYHRIAGYDWLAIPLVPYLYAVDTLEEIPHSADAQDVRELRDAYRRAHLLAIAPSDPSGHAPQGDWTQLVGSAYDRKIYGFQIETSAEQDQAFMQRFNGRENRSHYNVLFANCADFARAVLNFYAPRAVHRNFFADAGITTPKQVARSLVGYARHHPIVELSSFQIPQMPGSIQRSRPAAGVAEGLIKSKKYVVPLAILSPVVTGSIAVVYLAEGRFNPKRGAGVFDIARADRPKPARTATSVVTVSDSMSSNASSMSSSASNAATPAETPGLQY
jgi:hypothetical protein